MAHTDTVNSLNETLTHSLTRLRVGAYIGIAHTDTVNSLNETLTHSLDYG
jgi:hypothetical protein